jgi:hypothetical protein
MKELSLLEYYARDKADNEVNLSTRFLQILIVKKIRSKTILILFRGSHNKKFFKP